MIENDKVVVIKPNGKYIEDVLDALKPNAWKPAPTPKAEVEQSS